jgi:hypothetical protein
LKILEDEVKKAGVILSFKADEFLKLRMMILLQQNKKRRESGKKCHVRNYDVQ